MPFQYSNRPGLVDGRAFESIKRSAAESAGREQYWTPITGAPPRDQLYPPPPSPAPPAPALLPFELYQLQSSSSSSSEDDTGDSTGDSTTQPDTGPDWRSNFTVHSGTVSNIIPDNDDSADESDGGPVRITIPAETSKYLVWVTCSIDTDDGTVTDVTIDHGASGWDGYPKQPEGDDDTGDPPDTFYLTIAAITTGSDDPTDSDYHELDISQYINTSIWLDMVGYQIQCDDLNGIVLLKRMSARAV